VENHEEEGAVMRIAHSGDWHLSGRGVIAGRFILQDGMSLPLIDRVKALEKICSYVEENRIDLIVIAGDIFDQNNPEAVAIKVAVKTIERLAQIAPTIICSGNHDWKGGTAGALAPFGDIARRNGIYVSENPESFSLLIKNIKVNLSVLPYPRRSELKENQELKSASPEEMSVYISHKMEEKLSEFSAKIERDAVNLLVGHFSVDGSQYSKEQTVPPFDISVRRQFLEPFDLTCLGHLHAPQEFYSGAIARNGFGEEEMPVGFKVYNLAMGISNKKICDIDEQFIDLPAREYLTVSPEEFLKDGNFSPDAAVRVKGKVPKHEYDAIIRKMKLLNIPFLKNSMEIEMETARTAQADVSEEPSIEEALAMWAKGRDGVDKFLDKLILVGKEVEQKYSEVKP
jgi:exonuclease SbcD